MSTCKISFLTATYNHERYVRAFLGSVLTQSVADWELVIVDDHSTDGNVAAIRTLPDPRIRLIRHERNEGLNKSLQDAFLASHGDIVCLLASDDLIDVRYAEKIRQTFGDHPETAVVYAPLRVIDGEGKPTGDLLSMPAGLSREDLFAEMVIDRNRLVSPGMAVRREAFQSLMPLNVAAQQCQDYLIHLNLLYRYDFFILSEPLVSYRRHSGNVSGDGAAVAFREASENLLLMNSVRDLIGGDVEGFVRCFSGKTSLRPQCADDIPFVLGMLTLKSSVDVKRYWGFNEILSCISTERGARRIYDTYGIDYAAIRKLSAEVVGSGRSERVLMGEAIMDLQHKVVKYKRLFAAAVVVSLIFLIALSLVGCWLAL